MEDIIAKLKGEIITQLNLEDKTPDDIQTDAALFGDGLGLDSIDALELIVLLEKNYGLKLDKPEDGRAVFYSVRSMAEFIQSKKK